jgi:hypothetical protein
MVSINVPDSTMQDLAGAFGCQIATMPFTYLGLPMVTTKPRMEDLTPLMDRVERRLNACSNFLSYSGLLEMINFVITPTVTYAMCSLKLPVGVIENIDRIRKQCLWRGNDATKKGGNLIWSRYYTSKVPHLSPETGSFWWKHLLRLHILFRGIAKCTIGNGASVSFWEDLWAGQVLSKAFLTLFSFALNDNISVQGIMLAEDIDSLFFLPLSPEAMDELIALQDLLNVIPYNPEATDSWSFIWGSSIYSSRKYYRSVFNNFSASPLYEKMWHSKCSPRIKFSMWLVVVDHLNTKSMLFRRNYNVQPNANCVMCLLNVEKDLDHLFFSCLFATACWQKLGFQW